MQITEEYSKAYVEVLEIIKALSAEEYKRIPKERIEIYEKYKDENYKFELDLNKKLDQQISTKTKAIISNLFVKFISTKEDRQKIIENDKRVYWEKELNKKSAIKLNPLFEDKKKTETVEENKNEIIQYKNGLFKRIFLKIKSLLKNKGR